MNLSQHPLSAAFPSMSAEDFQALKDDIEVNGQREPVMLFEGMVLDGWHRYRACVDLGLKPQQFTFSDDDPVAFVKSQNLHRRHLTASQRAAAVVACSAWVPAKKQARGEATSPLAKTNAEMASEAHVTPRTIQQAKVAQKAGLSEAVKDGALTVEQAARIATGKPAKPEKKGETKTAPAAASAPADFGPSAAEVAAAERETAEELEALRKIALSDDKVAAALSEAKKLRALNRVLQERNDGLMNEKAELIKRIKSLQRKLDQVGQAA